MSSSEDQQSRRHCRHRVRYHWYPFSSTLACAFVLALLTNCGFQPLYGQQTGSTAGTPRGSTVSDMAYVAVDTIPDRAGQLVRNFLLDGLHTKGAAPRQVFRLVIDLVQRQEGLAFQLDDSATRYNLRLGARFKLVDIRTDTSLFKGHTQAIAAYNVVRSDYANLISEKDALRRAAKIVAEGIQVQISVYFYRIRG